MLKMIDILDVGFGFIALDGGCYSGHADPVLREMMILVLGRWSAEMESEEQPDETSHAYNVATHGGSGTPHGPQADDASTGRRGEVLANVFGTGPSKPTERRFGRVEQG
jgi:hypothetical protein